MARPPRALNANQIRRLNSDQARTASKWASRAQIWIFKKTKGRVGGRHLRGAPVGILTTIGRKSGQARESPLLYLQDGERIVLVASQGGRDDNPMWYLNLKSNADVTFRTRTAVVQLTARDATDAERDEYWPKLDAMYPDFSNYRSYTDRKIPIVICDPRST
jgi:deazaflavin-dependent oxidoreductase (nitroreductase family)